MTTYSIEVRTMAGLYESIPVRATTDRGARRKYSAYLRAMGKREGVKTWLAYRHDSGATGTL